MVGGPYDALKQACYGAQKDRLLLVQYETVTTDPAKTMHAVYAFIGEPAFEHEFDRVDYDVTEFDERAGTPGLHTVRSTVKAEPRVSTANRCVSPSSPQPGARPVSVVFLDTRELAQACSRGFVQRRPGNRMKSVSAEAISTPCSTARAASCASETKLPVISTCAHNLA